MIDLITRLRAARIAYADSPRLGHILHDAEEELEERRAAERRLRSEVLSLREQVSALESREVCTVAHDDVEVCGYCQRDALRKDAERYRWLRDSAGNDIMEKLMAECSPPRWDELVDAAIDAAMGERP